MSLAISGLSRMHNGNDVSEKKLKEQTSEAGYLNVLIANVMVILPSDKDADL